jgi:hypothetical protein
LNLFVAGLLMISAALGLKWFSLYVPAEWLAATMPAMLCVGFAFWLVYRLRTVREAKSRRWALTGATCLAIVAMSFGAAVGKLSMVFSTDTFESFIFASIHDPSFKRAGLLSMLAFTAIGFVFGLTFIRRAARGPWSSTTESTEHVRKQLSRLGERVIQDWDDQLVSRIDSLVEQNMTQEAVALFKKETCASQEEAKATIADWPEHRVRLQVDLLCNTFAERKPALETV